MLVPFPNDATNGNNDTLEVQLLFPKDFEVGESILYGNTSKSKQITVHIESGVYEEDYPLKFRKCYSRGDDYRRVIIKSKDRVQSFGKHIHTEILNLWIKYSKYWYILSNRKKRKQGFFGYLLFNRC